MRKVFSVAVLAAMLCLVGITKDAGATVTIALEWGSVGAGISIGAPNVATCNVGNCAGTTLQLDVFLSHNLTAGLESHAFSLNFDTAALEDEFNLGNGSGMVGNEWAGTDVNPQPGVENYFPFTMGTTSDESGGGTAGRINSYESGSLSGVLPATGVAYTVGTVTATAPARYRVGQLFLTTNGALTDNEDFFTGLFNGVFDNLIDGDSVVQAPGTLVFGTATLNVIPEPGTVSLLGLGLVGLVLAGRRSRRS